MSPRMYLSALTDANQEIRYLIMRTLRLVIAMALVPVIFATLPIIAASAFMGLFIGVIMLVAPLYHMSASAAVAHQIGFVPTNPHSGWYWFGTWRVFAVFAASVSAFIFTLMQYGAVSIPYQFLTTMPTFGGKDCWKCGVTIPDHLRCEFCGALRPGRLTVGLLWMLSLVVTLFWHVFNAFNAILLFLINRK